MTKNRMYEKAFGMDKLKQKLIKKALNIPYDMHGYLKFPENMRYVGIEADTEQGGLEKLSEALNSFVLAYSVKKILSPPLVVDLGNVSFYQIYLEIDEKGVEAFDEGRT